MIGAAGLEVAVQSSRPSFSRYVVVHSVGVHPGFPDERLLTQWLLLDYKVLCNQCPMGDCYLLKKYLQLDCHALHPRTELAKVYQKQHRFDDAEAVLQDLLYIDHRNLHARVELAKIYQRQGRLGDAEKCLKEYLLLDAHGLHPRLELAKITSRTGEDVPKTENV